MPKNDEVILQLELKIVGRDAAARADVVVGRVLDAGYFQEAINDYANDHGNDMRVASVLVVRGKTKTRRTS